MDCENCVHNQADDVPFIVHEGIMSRMERTIKRLWITILLLIVLLVGSNALWIVYENSFEDVEITQENADGYNNYIGNDGDIINGEADN